MSNLFTKDTSPKALFQQKRRFWVHCCPTPLDPCCDPPANDVGPPTNCNFSLNITDDDLVNAVGVYPGGDNPLTASVVYTQGAVVQHDVFINPLISPVGGLNYSGTSVSGDGYSSFAFSSPSFIPVTGSATALGQVVIDTSTIGIFQYTVSVTTDCGNVQIQMNVEIVAAP